MKTNELRLGNWVQVNGIPRKIVMIQTREFADWDRGDDTVVIIQTREFEDWYNGGDTVVMVDGYDLYLDCIEEELIPIPITEEILLSCGFKYNERTGDYIYCRFDEDIYVAVFSRPSGWGISIQANDMNIQMKFDYLHELQNIYFIATGEELEVKL